MGAPVVLERSAEELDRDGCAVVATLTQGERTLFSRWCAAEDRVLEQRGVAHAGHEVWRERFLSLSDAPRAGRWGRLADLSATQLTGVLRTSAGARKWATAQMDEVTPDERLEPWFFQPFRATDGSRSPLWSDSGAFLAMTADAPAGVVGGYSLPASVLVDADTLSPLLPGPVWVLGFAGEDVLVTVPYDTLSGPADARDSAPVVRWEMKLRRGSGGLTPVEPARGPFVYDAACGEKGPSGQEARLRTCGSE